MTPRFYPPGTGLKFKETHALGYLFARANIWFLLTMNNAPFAGTGVE
jgi:hypothetical protein